jgi:hypothetical protein
MLETLRQRRRKFQSFGPEALAGQGIASNMVKEMIDEEFCFASS